MSAADGAALVAALSDPGFHPGRPEVQVRETHASWVFLAGDRAYKLKKPVVFPFLDYGTPERRRDLCREEVRLNARLAPSTYLGVRSVVPADGGFALAEDGDARAVEHVVEMRRLREDRTLERLVPEGAVPPAELEAIGRRLAAFHRDAERADPGDASPARLKRTFDETFETLLGLAPGAEPHIRAAERFTDAFLGAHADLLAERAAAGHVRDGHGDLRAEHVVLDEEVEVFDCVEFDPALRRIDVADDMAFLAMDLERLGAPDAARAVLDAYRDAGGDPGPDRLIAFYAAQRAWVRAKVTLLRGREDEAATLLDLGRRLTWRARRPLLLVVCGGAATGKSTVAAAASGAGAGEHVSSDAVRKELAGLAEAERGGEELYTPERSVAVYAELGRRAAALVEETGGAVLDATFRRAAERAAFAEAAGPAGGHALFVECRAPARVVAERAARRAGRPEHGSDATEEVALEQAAAFEPLDEVEARRHLALRTDRDAGEVLADLEAMLDMRMRG